MANRNSFVLLLILAMLLPVSGYALEVTTSKIQFTAQVISFFNLVLFITSLLSIRQYFWPGDVNRMPFHIFHAIFIVIFYSFALPFLVINRPYYVGYDQLDPLGVLGKFFLSLNISSFEQLVIIATFFINVLYVKRYYTSYFEAGIAEPEPDEEDKDEDTKVD